MASPGGLSPADGVKATPPSRLDRLESRSIHILREAHAAFPSLGMLWSVGKDSTVLLWLARRAFIGDVPFPLIHVDTGFKLPEMIAYRDRLVREWGLSLIVGSATGAREAKQTFPDGAVDRLTCCRLLKSEALRATLNGTGPRLVFDHETATLRPDPSPTAFQAVIAGIRADEEGSRSKERVFSPRGEGHHWDVADQPPELWDFYKTEVAPGTHVRVHPLLDWTEVDVWAYIERESIPMVPLYFDDGTGQRYRSLGCGPCTAAIASPARNAAEVIAELTDGALARVRERAGRAQDEATGGLESLRRDGYM